jgi:hypothetical protein
MSGMAVTGCCSLAFPLIALAAVPIASFACEKEKNPSDFKIFLAEICAGREQAVRSR